jgi:hypothetical protein
MTKICRRNIFLSKRNAFARHIFLKSKLQENPPVNRRVFHIMKFDNFSIFWRGHSGMPESKSGSSAPTESGFDPFTDQKINLQEEEKTKY